MIECRFHGRGGQGAVTGCELMVYALSREGKYAQAFPFFGFERRGAPVTSFLRIDSEPILIRQQVYEPDAVVVLDAGLVGIVPWQRGIKKGGLAVINVPEGKAPKPTVEFSALATVDATGISLQVFGPTAIPITNTAMLGALAKATGWVKPENVHEAIKYRFGGAMADRNIKAVQMAYDQTKIEKLGGS